MHIWIFFIQYIGDVRGNAHDNQSCTAAALRRARVVTRLQTQRPSNEINRKEAICDCMTAQQKSFVRPHRRNEQIRNGNSIIKRSATRKKFGDGVKL